MEQNELNEKVSKFTNTRLIVAESHLTVKDATQVMLDAEVDSVLVFENDDVIGIVTYKDILKDVVAKGLNSSEITIKEIMKSPLIKIHKDATVKEAIKMMEKNNIRRLIVHDDKRTIGIITRIKIIGEKHKNAVHLPKLEKSETV